jgi:plastocyanin
MTRTITSLASLAGALALSLFLGAGCGGDDNGTGGNNGGTVNSTIQIVPNAFNKGMMAFLPDTDSVRVNDVVRMQNTDATTHIIQTVTPNGPSWGTISGGSSVNATATTAGTFQFHCTVGGHTMTGTLVVTP